MTEARATERATLSADINALAAESEPRDHAMATLLRALVKALADGRPEEARGFASAIDPHGLAEALVRRHSSLWSLLEVLRNVLVFSPIAVTWYSLSSASAAYASLIGSRPELLTRPFLLLWQEGFEGAAAVINFSTLAIIDASLIGVLIALSFALHLRADLGDAATRTKVLLKESHIRTLLARASTLAGREELADAEADATLDEMVAEERRIYERAMEREQQLADLEAAVRELRRAAADLALAAEAMTRPRRQAKNKDDLIVMS